MAAGATVKSSKAPHVPLPPAPFFFGCPSLPVQDWRSRRAILSLEFGMIVSSGFQRDLCSIPNDTAPTPSWCRCSLPQRRHERIDCDGHARSEIVAVFDWGCCFDHCGSCRFAHGGGCRSPTGPAVTRPVNISHWCKICRARNGFNFFEKCTENFGVLSPLTTISLLQSSSSWVTSQCRDPIGYNIS